MNSWELSKFVSPTNKMYHENDNKNNQIKIWVTRLSLNQLHQNWMGNIFDHDLTRTPILFSNQFTGNSQAAMYISCNNFFVI